MGHKPSGGQILKSHKITNFINYNALAGLVQEMVIVSVDQMVLKTRILCKEFVLLRRAISLKVNCEKVIVLKLFFAITLVIMIMNHFSYKSMFPT